MSHPSVIPDRDTCIPEPSLVTYESLSAVALPANTECITADQVKPGDRLWAVTTWGVVRDVYQSTTQVQLCMVECGDCGGRARWFQVPARVTFVRASTQG